METGRSEAWLPQQPKPGSPSTPSLQHPLPFDGVTRLSLRAVGDQYLADLDTRAVPESIRQARGALKRILAGLGVEHVEDLTKTAVDAWRRARLAGGASNRTTNVDVGALQAALNLAVRLGQVRASPLAGLRALPTSARHRRRVARVLKEAEICSLLAAAAASDAKLEGFPREPLLRALILTGARWGELTSTVWADLDVDAQALTLRAETTKMSRERTIPLDPFAFDGIMGLREHHGRIRRRLPTQDARVFLTPNGADWSRDTGNFRRWLRNVMIQAGIDYRDGVGRVLHVHAMRHTFCTRLLRQGVSVQVAQKLTGHASPAMLLQVYNGLGMEGTRDALLSLPRISIPTSESPR